MTRTELETLLNTLGCQVFYNHTTRKDQVTLPFIVYLETRSNNLMADNQTYKEFMSYTIVIHSATRDVSIEASLKQLLINNKLPYEISSIDWDEDLLMWRIAYDIGL